MLDDKNHCRLRSLIAVVTIMLVAGAARSADRSLPDGQPISEHHRGDFAVGHSTQRLNVRGTRGELRPLDVHLWYPARSHDDCDSPSNLKRGADDQGCSLTPTVYRSRLYGIPLLPQWDPLSWTIGSSESFENLPIARGHRRFPVIVFSHGQTGEAIEYVYTLEALASFGFIVAAPDHLNGTADDVRIDFINSEAGFDLLPCFDGLASPCTRAGAPENMTDRVHDVSAVLDALPTWFGERVDMTRVGIMGHSRGSVTALAVAGGSTTWGFPPEPRVKALMGLAIGGNPAVVFAVDLQNITIPALLLAGTLDTTSPPEISRAAFELLASTDKELVLIENAVHCHFCSALCAQTQSAGGIASASTRAILDLHTFRTNVAGLPPTPNVGVAMDYCGFETFTDPSDIRPLVASLTGFHVTPTNVPTTGVDSAEVTEDVVELAVAFFGRVLRAR